MDAESVPRSQRRTHTPTNQPYIVHREWNKNLGHHVREFIFCAHTYSWPRTTTRLLCWRLTNGFGTGENKSLLRKFKLLLNPYFVLVVVDWASIQSTICQQWTTDANKAEQRVCCCCCGLNTRNYHNEIAILQTGLYGEGFLEHCSCQVERHVDVFRNHPSSCTHIHHSFS